MVTSRNKTYKQVNTYFRKYHHSMLWEHHEGRRHDPTLQQVSISMKLPLTGLLASSVMSVSSKKAQGSPCMNNPLTHFLCLIQLLPNRISKSKSSNLQTSPECVCELLSANSVFHLQSQTIVSPEYYHLHGLHVLKISFLIHSHCLRILFPISITSTINFFFF